MTNYTFKIKILIITPILFTLFNCAPHQNFHGTFISEDEINKIIVNKTTLDKVIEKFGEPSFEGAFNNKYYYKYEKTKISPAGKKEFLIRNILVLEIDNNKTIINKEKLDLENTMDILPAKGKTETAGTDFTIFQQIFSNLRSGRFASSD